jgi:hypothetical protein
VSPCGQLICVSPAQCAYLDEWLSANQTEVGKVLAGSPPSGSPPGAGAIGLYVVLCYAECLTDKVPIPGEPCRSEDDTMAPSRVRDDFSLELRLSPPGQPPDQREEEAVRRFVAWFRSVPVVDGPGSTLQELLQEIRTAAHLSGTGSPPQASAPAGSQGGCPPVADFMGLPPLPSLAIPRADAANYLRAALRLWTTELLPCWRAAVPGCGQPCGGGQTPAADADCLVLAHLLVDVAHDPVQDRLLVGPAVTIDEKWRPFLVDGRFLMEWAITGPGSPSLAPKGLGAAVVAAGRFALDGNASPPPTARPRAADPDVFDLDFHDLHTNPGGNYTVTGSVMTANDAKAHAVEVLVPNPTPAVRLRRVGTGTDAVGGLMLQVTRFDGAGP